MHVLVEALDHNTTLESPVEPYELVSSVKQKINQRLGGNVPEDVIDTLNYKGTTLSCGQPLSVYGIKHKSTLKFGSSLLKPQVPGGYYQYQQYPSYGQYGNQYPQFGQQYGAQFQQQYGQLGAQYPQFSQFGNVPQFGQQFPQFYGQQRFF